MRLDYLDDLSRTYEALAKKFDERSIAKLLDVRGGLQAGGAVSQSITRKIYSSFLTGGFMV